MERIVGRVNELIFKISDEEIISGIQNWLNGFLEKYSFELQRYTGRRNI